MNWSTTALLHHRDVLFEYTVTLDSKMEMYMYSGYEL